MKRRSREKKERKKEGQKTEQRGLTPVGPLLCPFSGGDCSGGNCTSENCSHVCVCFFSFCSEKGVGWVSATRRKGTPRKLTLWPRDRTWSECNGFFEAST